MYIAMDILRSPSNAPSVIYDMESFVWTFLDTAMVAKYNEWMPCDHKWHARYLKPRYVDYDAARKSEFLTTLPVENLTKSVLKPYRDFIPLMARTALKYDLQSRLSDFEGFDEQAEVNAVKEYIDIFERLANFLREAKATH